MTYAKSTLNRLRLLQQSTQLMNKYTSIFIALLLMLGTPAQSEPASCPALLDHHVKVLHKKQQIHLCEDYANTVILVVNTASQCGFTPQFEGLEKLYQTYKDQGFVVLGFPSNDFTKFLILLM